MAGSVLVGAAVIACWWLLHEGDPAPLSRAPFAEPHPESTPAKACCVETAAKPIATPAAQPPRVAAAPRGPIAIQVLAPNGAPTADATLEVLGSGRSVFVASMDGIAWDPTRQAFTVDDRELWNCSAGGASPRIRARTRTAVSRTVAITPHSTTPGDGSTAPPLITLALRTTVSHEVQVRMADGSHPVRDVLVCMSASAIGEDDLEESGDSPGPTASGIHRARTDAAGAARIGGLLPGIYHVRILPPWPLAATSGPRDGRVDVAAGSTTFTLEPMAAAGLQITNGRVLTVNVNATAVSFANASQRHLARADTTLRQSWPSALIQTCFARPRRTDRAMVHFDALIADVGWVRRSVEVRPVGDGWQPEILDVSGIAPSMTFRTIRIAPDWRLPFPAPESSWPPMVFEQGGRIPTLSLAVAWNQEVLVPVGAGRLVCAAPWKQGFGSIDIGPGTPGGLEKIAVPLPAERVPCRLRVIDEAGIAVSNVSVRAGSRLGATEALLKHPATSELWLPLGDNELRVEVPGYAPFTSIVAIERPGQELSVTVVSP